MVQVLLTFKTACNQKLQLPTHLRLLKVDMQELAEKNE